MTRLPARRRQFLAAALAMPSLLAIASACGDDDAKTPTPMPTTVATRSATTAATATLAATPSPTPTAAPPTVTAAACPANFIVSGVAQPVGGTFAITLKFTASGAPCLYAGPVMVRLLDSGGVPLLGMAENPVTFNAASDTLLLSWRNWCAAPGTFRASVSAGNATTLVGIPGPPSCTAPKEKSMLSLAMP